MAKSKVNLGSRLTVAIILNFMFSLLVGYFMINYTREMKNHPTCSGISPNKRELMYLMGVVTIAHVLFNIFLLMVR